MKNYNRIILLAITLLVPGLLLTVSAQKKVELKYNLTTGDQYTYNIETDQDISFEASGQTMVMNSKIGFEMTGTVEDNTSDNIVVKTIIDRVTMTQSIFGMEIKYDSKDPSSTENPMAAKIAEAFSGLIGSSYTMTMDNKGNVKEMDMKELTDNDDLAQNLSSGSNYAIYKDGKVAVGDSWEKDIEPLKTSDMKYHIKYTVLKISKKETTLGVEGTITANSIDNEEINLEGTQTGEMIVNTQTGWLIKSVIDQELSLDIEQAGQKFPATISGTTISTSVKK
ncbi:MAG: hypothetical protein DRI89_09770 [Bacteroidetes bacterium]|nr:MAG: hypothetical protein DRI89_09770 [Bacteroidota bacterium]